MALNWQRSSSPLNRTYRLMYRLMYRCCAASLLSSPWSCSLDGHIPCGARSPGSVGMLCVSEDQLEANGSLVIFFPDSQESGQPSPAPYDVSRTEADTVSMLRLALAQALSCPAGCPPPCRACMRKLHMTESTICSVSVTPP